VPGTRPTNPGSSTPPTTAPRPTAPPVTTPPITPPPPPSSGGKGQIAANAAISQIGVRYSWGGGNASGPSYGFGEGAGIKGFDCSGLTLYAWAQAGVYLYHSAQMQYDGSRHLAISQLQVGDLVFYGTSSTNISHVGIYIGNGQIVHAPNSRSLVQTGPVYLWNGYYAWVGAGRPG
jgi:cell wall-associated NlpC family hydrolase